MDKKESSNTPTSSSGGGENKSFSVSFAKSNFSSDAGGADDTVECVAGDQDNDCTRYFQRDNVKRVMQSYYYQVTLICLVVVEAVVVVVELMVEAEGASDLSGRELHVVALVLLGLFNVELLLKIIVLREEILHSWSEVADGIIVVVATILEATSFYHRGAARAGGLVLLLRLWRLVRIQNSMVAASRLANDEKLQAEKDKIQKLQDDLAEKQRKIEKLEARNSALELMTVQHGLMSSVK